MPLVDAACHVASAHGKPIALTALLQEISHSTKFYKLISPQNHAPSPRPPAPQRSQSQAYFFLTQNAKWLVIATKESSLNTRRRPTPLSILRTSTPRGSSSFMTTSSSKKKSKQSQKFPRGKKRRPTEEQKRRKGSSRRRKSW